MQKDGVSLLRRELSKAVARLTNHIDFFSEDQWCELGVLSWVDYIILVKVSGFADIFS